MIIAGIVAFCIAYSTKAIAQVSPIEKTWYDSKKSSKIQIYKAPDGRFYGKILWLDKTTDPSTGKAYTDKKNPNENLRTQPLMGVILLQGFQQDMHDKNVYTGGTVYDPNNGKTYCGEITCKGNKLAMKGYLCSFTIFSRTEEWTLADDQQAEGN